MNRRRAGRRISHSQRRGAPSGGQWRQINKDQWQDEGTPQVREVVGEAQRPGQHGREAAPRGTCQTMCPARELRNREAQNRLHRLEMLPGTDRDRRPRGDPLRAVKEYSRPAAGKDSTNPAELRPPAVLLKTVCYLIDEITASSHQHPWTEVYSFVFDRLRSVKQDMIIQRVSGSDCVAILERTVRFLIYASYRLCGEPLRLYDPRINDTHLQEYLSWLLGCYATGSEPHPNQEEFQALALLFSSCHAAHLGTPRATPQRSSHHARSFHQPGVSGAKPRPSAPVGWQAELPADLCASPSPGGVSQRSAADIQPRIQQPQLLLPSGKTFSALVFGHVAYSSTLSDVRSRGQPGQASGFLQSCFL
uniref:SAC3/GANP/THP3 conserved domain-containing protein n=1 Tax=Amphiprion ocellaris TaxID=80972 RepID=A0AAQ5Y209_AMPOC